MTTNHNQTTSTPTGQDIAYKRVSSHDQNTDRQLADVNVAFAKVFEDHATGSDTDRPGFAALVDYARAGDVIHVHSIDRLCRSLSDLETTIRLFNDKGVTIHFHKENLIVGAAGLGGMDKFLLQILGAVAEFERSMIKERQAEGIARRRQRLGSAAYPGRSADVRRRSQIRELLAAGGSIRKVAAEVGCAPNTVMSVKREMAALATAD